MKNRIAWSKFELLKSELRYKRVLYTGWHYYKVGVGLRVNETRDIYR